MVGRSGSTVGTISLKRIHSISVGCLLFLTLLIRLSASTRSGTAFIPSPTIRLHRRFKKSNISVPIGAGITGSNKMSDDNSSESIEILKRDRPLVKNFRPVVGTANIYRCAKTDTLSQLFEEQQPTSEIDETNAKSQTPERVLLHDAKLVIDLRSPSERDYEQMDKWLRLAPGGSFTRASINKQDYQALEPTSSSHLSFLEDGGDSDRWMIELDPLSADLFMKYLEENWIESPQAQMQLNWFKLTSGDALHTFRIDILNKRGLEGLNEAILEIGGHDLCTALKAITIHLEKQNPGSPVVFNCVQGKDRTGLLAMLCQSILEIPDDIIIDEYNLSEEHLGSQEGSAAVESRTDDGGGPSAGRIDRRFFSGAPKHVMRETLSFLRDKYGSVSPGYLDNIGFNADWRRRFINVVRVNVSAITRSDVNRLQSKL